jgi:polysaccharide deacetylase family protein (PEP-CTERM system associated)
VRHRSNGWPLTCEPDGSEGFPLSPQTERMNSIVATTTHFFTVDVEEYFQVQALESVVTTDEWLSRPTRVGASVDALLEALDRHGVRGTFFTLGWLAKYRPEVVRAIANAGHEVASHGFRHERVTSLTPQRFREDIRSSRQALEDLTGRVVLGYRAPSFSIIPGFEWAFDVLVEEGYRYDSSIFPIRRRGYGYPSAPRAPYVIHRPSGTLAEFPLATVSVFRLSIPAAGGGYLRQFPFALIRRAFREAGQRGEPGTFYIHPWELDPQQPRMPVSPLTHVRHYRGLATTGGKVEKLLTEFAFRSIASSLPSLASVPHCSSVGAA